MTPGELNGMQIVDLLEGEPISIDELLSDQSVNRELHTRKKDGAELYVRVVSAPYPLTPDRKGTCV